MFLQGIEFWAVNTDAQALAHHSAANKVQIGTQVTRGLGCGGNPELGKQAASESEQVLQKMVSGAGLVFITAGMGGGTGTGAAPVVAKISKDAGVLGWFICCTQLSGIWHALGLRYAGCKLQYW